MITHLVAFAAGGLAVFLWMSSRSSNTPAAPTSPAVDALGSRPPTSDDDLEARIIEYLSSNVVYHINDLCQSLEHPKGARYVRAHFHKLMEEGKIRYKDMVYTI